ncbi:hypothetical protein MCSF7_00849 [Mycoplasmopsis columbina SF7]|uniref:Transmembrane protein n=1 Tax=Mycoplasmopsis columbina SF7 TaxID=1037410 RepID=F9UJW3_9BACT|nr:hypothetical protein [Mycoplasmopsis columbina]EGV00309.1 hypothetical protein MCSF7_00849 [Mycoplasmopsis columbina SF7]
MKNKNKQSLNFISFLTQILISTTLAIAFAYMTHNHFISTTQRFLNKTFVAMIIISLTSLGILLSYAIYLWKKHKIKFRDLSKHIFLNYFCFWEEKMNEKYQTSQNKYSLKKTNYLFSFIALILIYVIVTFFTLITLNNYVRSLLETIETYQILLGEVFLMISVIFLPFIFQALASYLLTRRISNKKSI